MFCNKENYTYVGDHCEYYQCASNCYSYNLTGLCRGWDAKECAFINYENENYVYDSDYNDYLSCYKYCTSCQ